mmetsp:Transcript_77616/g.90510  ORF Transcript_77616/g.90510 Transcript_77616/m.90510 type:complete len:1092 (+) Transcript_77616:29-3304(+)
MRTTKMVFSVAVAVVLLAGAVLGTNEGCASVSASATTGLFAGSSVNWGCEAPFECLVTFCGCIASNSSNSSVQCLSGVFNINGTNASQLETCSSSLATCVLAAALASPGASDRSCRTWGASLIAEYATAYTAHSAGSIASTNLTASCTADFCSLSVNVSGVNVSNVCSFASFGWPAPVASGVMPQCVAAQTTRTYYSAVPLSSCSNATACMTTFCQCVQGTWNSTTYSCSVPTTVNATSATVCLTTAMSCLLSVALSTYVVGASPLNADPCVAWSVPFAEDYASYYAATTKTTTMLYETCNYTACNVAIGDLDTTDFSAVCNLPTTVTPTFTAYNACPYSCPDTTCSYSLASCACTANATIKNVQVVTSPTLNETVDVSKSLTVAAYANYSVSSGNCSGYNFNSALSFRWTLYSVSGSVLTTVRDANSSTLTLSAGSLTGGTSYVLLLRLTGLLATQSVTQTYNFTATIPSPTLQFRNGASTRLGTSNSLTLSVTVTDYDTTVASYNWSCVASSGTCPTLSNVTNASATILNGSATAGSFTITYTYRSVYTANFSLTVVDGTLPVVNVFASTTALNTVPLVYLSSQSIVIGSAVVYPSKNVTYAWTIGSNTTVIGTSATLTLNSSNWAALTKTTLANAVAANPTMNTVTLTVTAASGTYGSGSLSLALLEAVTVSLTVANNNGGSTATSLSSTLLLTPTVTGMTTAPYSATTTYTLSYNDNVSGTITSFALTTTPSGTSYTATAPMLATSVSSTTFTVTLALNGITAASGTASFEIDAPSDLGAATTSVLSSLSSTSDPAALAQAAVTLSALASASANSTVAAAAALGLVTALASVDISDLSSSQVENLMTSLAALLPSLDASTLTAQANSLQASMVSTLATATTEVALAVAKAAANLPGKNAAGTYVKVGDALMKNVNVGQVLSLLLQELQVLATAMSAASMASSTIGTGESCAPSAALADGFVLDGVVDTDVVQVALTKSASPPYGDATPSGSTLTMEILVNGKSYNVTGLSVPIVLTLACDAGQSGCQSISSTSSTWTSDSNVTTTYANGRVQCHTTHLTSFATFPSSAAAVGVSLVALLLMVVSQMM